MRLTFQTYEEASNYIKANKRPVCTDDLRDDQEILTAIFCLIVGDLDGCGLVVTDEDLLRQALGLPKEDDA